MLPNVAEVSEPALPLAPVGSEDREAHAMFRVILEDIAAIKTQTMREAERAKVLADLDQLAVEQRGSVGRYLLDHLDSVADSPEGVEWHLRRVSGAFGATQLGFGVCSQAYSEMVSDIFASWVELRHFEFCERVGLDGEKPITVAVLVSPRNDRDPPWDTTLTSVEGALDLTEERLKVLYEVWHPEAEVTASPPDSSAAMAVREASG